MGARHWASEPADGLPRREDLVQAASRSWTARLDDAARRSSLLRYGDGAGGALDLAGLDPDAVDRLLRGDTVTPWPGGNPEHERIGEHARRLADLSLASREEQGVDGLHVAMGMVTWRPEGSGPAPVAPVVLLPVELVDLASGPSRAIRRTGELTWNPVLAYVLETDYRRSFEALGPPDGARGPLPDGLWQLVRDLGAEVPGFALHERIVLGHFLSYHVHLLNELRLRPDAMAGHDLIAALAGDRIARARLRDRAGMPQGPAVAGDGGRRRIVLPADQTQRQAVDAVCRGESCTIEGPPGSGKSQTIANVVAALVADGQKVLLVAQKRAALDAVRQRLEARDLGHLTLDLLGAETSRRAVLERIADAIATKALTAPGEPADDKRLDETRQMLQSSLRALHQERGPSGLSLLDMQSRLLRLPEAVRTAGLRPLPGLAGMSAAAARHVEILLAGARDLGALLGPDPSSPWAAARLPDETAAIAAVDLSLRVYSLWQRMLAALGDLEAVLPSVRPSSLGEVEQVAAILFGVNETLRRYRPEVFRLGGPGASPPRPFRGPNGMPRHRAVAQALRALRRDPGLGLDGAEAAADRAAIADQGARWRSVVGAPQPVIHPEGDTLFAAVDALRAPLLKLVALLGPGRFGDLPLADAGSLLRRLADDTATPHRIPRAAAITRELERHGASQAAGEVFACALDPALWPQAFQYLWLTSCLDAARAEEPGLAGILGRHRDQLQERLFRLERAEMDLAAEQVRIAHARRVAAAFGEHPGQAAIVRQAAAANTPLPALLAAAPDVLLALFPCWLASPYAVSRLVDGDRRHFDVVIVDEASQLPAEAAIPAILRASRLVLAGDPRQLPPGDLALEGPGPAQRDAASVLDGLAFLPAYRLGWHYRSLDEALFAFSNRHIYQDAVMTFPGRQGHGAGLTHVVVSSQAGEGGGTASAADAEAQAVADLVLRHAEERRQESLGVIACDLDHAQRILAAVERAVAGRQDVASFFDRARSERFFVKPLDLVQGDERDAVILALGFDRPGEGGGLWQVGPFEGALGERRLNVAITRARRRMTVVSACGYEDIAEESCRGPGSGLLRHFLQFAAMRHGRQMAAELTDEPVNPLEQGISLFVEEVCGALRQAGIDCVPQYGSLRHRMDLAARHPDRPGEYLLAISCDGLERHAPPSEREYDRRRQLELLGWRYHRIFAGDWAADRGGEIRRALEVYRQAVAAADRATGSGNGCRDC